MTVSTPPAPSAGRTAAADPDVALRLGTAIARLARGFRTAPAGHDLSPSQLAVLAAVVRQGPLGLSALAEGEAINPTLLSRIVGRLEAEGLLERRAAESDRRCVVVAATPAGRRLQKRVRAARSAALAAGLEALSSAERRAVMAALPALERMAAGGGA